MTLAQQVSAAKERVVEAAKRYAGQRGKPDMRRIGSPSFDLLAATGALLALESETCTDCDGQGRTGHPNRYDPAPRYDCLPCGGTGRRKEGAGT